MDASNDQKITNGRLPPNPRTAEQQGLDPPPAVIASCNPSLQLLAPVSLCFIDIA
jgi:hypothetical protein